MIIVVVSILEQQLLDKYSKAIPFLPSFSSFFSCDGGEGRVQNTEYRIQNTSRS